MKKILPILLLLSVLILSSCGENPAEKTSTSAPTEAPEATPEVDLGYVTDGDDIHIEDDGVTLKDMVIEGDLYIDESVGDGEFYLENVEVKGTIYVNGGGENSGYFINVIGKSMVIEAKTNPSLKFHMGSSLESISIATDCSVTTDSEGIEHITVNNAKTQQAVDVLLQGDYPEVSIESTANVTLDGKVSLMQVLKNANMTSIDMVDTSKMYFFACGGESVTVHGGTIVEAWINAEYCSLPANVEILRSEVGVAEVTVDGVIYTHIPPYVPNDEDSGESGENSEPQENNGIILGSYPKVTNSGGVISITISATEKCTAYFLVEADFVASKGTTAENVRNGISMGAGMKMEDGSEYIVIAGSFSVDSALKEYTGSVNMANYIPDFEPMPGEGGGEYVFLVVEDSEGNLSQLFTLR